MTVSDMEVINGSLPVADHLLNLPTVGWSICPQMLMNAINAPRAGDDGTVVTPGRLPGGGGPAPNGTDEETDRSLCAALPCE
jgi:hypothetical protein